MSKTFKCDKCGDIDHVLIDGYPFGDRLLEGVMFEIRFAKGAKKYKAAITKDAREYFSTLNEKMWLKQAEEHAEGEDNASCPKCGGAVGMNDDMPQPERKPLEVKLESWKDVIGRAMGAQPKTQAQMDADRKFLLTASRKDLEKAVKDPNLKGDIDFLEDAGLPEIADSMRQDAGLKNPKRKGEK